ncbi:type I-C CRISPR-associated protein Cas7/Csd2 [Brevibacillus laterosporus]|uniref:type I-C CRISPR-associated protein Cas7/Csd2 n=1 Tax=Brevibacillus laterosporus TaxID=1465 RepID=UPI001126E04C|nr:type I-C CRISPR-associated protein Cas7/Csd2 [Brevibacillus laterosporus]MBG9801660.1 CRISPR-associated protein Csd2 [Brevibacillus laterosporus]MED2003023.1 type I-C CRISPR-associated protein Cas7/Csd2 [Brevibacillus laterosporus]MED4762162.1 type I-C CRISPR-associated protein Cas7/Csd2 [Brevibacillus laterosporus]TPH10692.1 type I-C CRISPR-associated protein Cas7/Csd2 [Brevibacillus laterosporus]
MTIQKTYQPIEKRYDFVIIFDVTNGNPNGDPDAGNMPRSDGETGHGIVTDVCLKRRVRNYIEMIKPEETGFQIYVTEGAVHNEQHRQAYYSVRADQSKIKTSEAKLIPKDKEEAKILAKWMCDNFYDVRTFGAVMSNSVNCGQIRGPVQFTFSQSVEPIFVKEITITRQSVTREGEDKQRTLGKKYIIPYALYRMNGFISAYFAEKSNFTEEDLNLLWEAIVHMFEHDRSASRGEMVVRKLIIFEHDSKLGRAPAHQLFNRIEIKKVLEQDQPARSYQDYMIEIDPTNLPNGVSIIEKY